jgi:hypothetical protein
MSIVHVQAFGRRPSWNQNTACPFDPADDGPGNVDLSRGVERGPPPIPRAIEDPNTISTVSFGCRRRPSHSARGDVRDVPQRFGVEKQATEAERRSRRPSLSISTSGPQQKTGFVKNKLGSDLILDPCGAPSFQHQHAHPLPLSLVWAEPSIRSRRSRNASSPRSSSSPRAVRSSRAWGSRCFHPSSAHPSPTPKGHVSRFQWAQGRVAPDWCAAHKSEPTAYSRRLHIQLVLAIRIRYRIYIYRVIENKRAP